MSQEPHLHYFEFPGEIMNSDKTRMHSTNFLITESEWDYFLFIKKILELCLVHVSVCHDDPYLEMICESQIVTHTV